MRGADYDNAMAPAGAIALPYNSLLLPVSHVAYQPAAILKTSIQGAIKICIV